MKFNGFSIELYRFLDELTANNNRDWFAAHKERYERVLLGPALAFIEAMGPKLREISPHFRAEVKKVGGSLMRIYRDTRFSKDKSPYKTNVGIQFRHAKGKDVHAPGFYVHLDPEHTFLGVGMWHPDGGSLAKVRKHIVKHEDDWTKARDGRAFRRRFELAGDSLKRPPKGFDPEHPLIEDLKRKDHIAVQYLEIDDMVAKGCVRKIAGSFQAAAPYIGELCKALRLKF